VSQLREVPWWLVATLALLGVALGLSIAAGQTGDSVIIAVVLALGILILVFYVAVALFGLRRDGRSGRGA
jgi:hypothetical protein